MNNFFLKRKNVIIIFVIFLLLPAIGFAITNIDSVGDGWYSYKNGGSNTKVIFWNSNNDRNNIATSTRGYCVRNSSGNDYFVPSAIATNPFNGSKW